MNRMTLKLWCSLAALSVAAPAFADEGDLVEKVAVRNRLYSVKGRWEVGGNFGLSMLPTMTDHYNLNVSGAYNVAEWFAAELRIGYAITRLTNLANDEVRVKQQTTAPEVSDLSNLWQMTFNTVVGARFQPLYGKINLLAELPVHFQLYLWAGAGLGYFRRESAVFCTRGTPRNCDEWHTKGQVGPLFSLALGFRFFIANHHGVKIEIRDWSFLDSYTEKAKRSDVNATNPEGTGGTLRTGLTNVVQLDLGYTYIF